MNCFKGVIFGFLIVGFSLQVNAAQVATRNEVSAILGVSELVEDFEGDGVDPGQQSTNVGSINSVNSSWITQPGVSYNASVLFLNDDGYFDLVTRTLADSASFRPITIEYDSPTRAMGVDLQDYVGLCADGTIEVFNGSGGLLGSAAVSADQFFGWEDSGGIGSVIFTADSDCYIMLDNHAFSAARIVPVANTAPIPTFSNWALLVLMTLMIGGAFVSMRRLN